MTPTLFKSAAVVVVGAATLLALGARRDGQGAILPPPTSVAALRAPATEGLQTVVFSGGCFWGVQGVFEHVKGVISATSGYAGGSADHATYGDVSSGETGHAESVEVVYDPTHVSFGQLLQVFFSVVHDPTQPNRQGPDVGRQYRSAIWYTTDAQRDAANAYITQLTDARTFSRPIVTEVNQLPGFYPAEEYHQDYLIHHPHEPYIVINDLPKIRSLHREFPDLWREEPVRWRATEAKASRP